MRRIFAVSGVERKPDGICGYRGWASRRRGASSSCRAGCAPTSRRRSSSAPCSAALIGALIVGPARLVDLVHDLAFNISGGHTLSTGIGVDIERVLIVPAVGGLLLGIAVGRHAPLRPAEVVDPIEANALHGGRMSMTRQPAPADRHHLVQRLGRRGRHGGGLQPARRRRPRQGRPVFPPAPRPTSASSSPPGRRRRSPPPSTRRWPAPSTASS